MNSYTEEINESEQVHTFTKLLCTNLDSKYGREELNWVLKNKCQHLIETQRNELLNFLQKFEDFSMEHLAPGKQIQYTSN